MVLVSQLLNLFATSKSDNLTNTRGCSFSVGNTNPEISFQHSIQIKEANVEGNGAQGFSSTMKRAKPQATSTVFMFQFDSDLNVKELSPKNDVTCFKEWKTKKGLKCS